MRVKSRWFGARPRTPEEVGGAIAFIAFRVARNLLAQLRTARFAVDAGPEYFEVLAEALAFTVQCACRVAWPGLDAAERPRFAMALAHRAADHLAENEAELLAARAQAEIRAAFIDRLNHRFAEYADFGYGSDGPDFAFLRYFASLLAERMHEEDRRWTWDQVIAIEGPEAATTVSRALKSLFSGDTTPRGVTA